MTKLEKFLIKNSSKIKKADKTLSTYYYINSITVRVSDHFPSESAELCDLYVIIPSESKCTTYVVQLPESKKCSIWNADKIINFIYFLQTYRKLTAVDERVIEIDGTKLSNIKSKFTVVQLNKRLRTAYSHSNAKTWTIEEQEVLKELLSKEFGLFVDFTTDFSTFLFTHNSGYNKVLNLYNTIVFNGGDFSKENIERINKTLKEYY